MNENKFNNGYIFAILAVIIWSTNFVAARYLTGLSPIEISFYRWLVTFLVLTPFCIVSLIKNIHLLTGLWIKIIIISVLGITIFNTFVYLAAHTSNATNMSLIATLSPIIIALISRVLWKKHLSKPQKQGLFIIILGVIILLTKGSIEVISKLKFSIGDLYMIFAVILFAVYTLTLRIKPKDFPQTTFFYLMVAIGLIPLAILMIPKYINNQAHILNFNLAIVLIYIGIFPSALGFIFWNIAVSKIGAMKASIIYDSVPFFSTVGAIILLHEKPYIAQIIGGVLILIGIIYSSLADNNKKIITK